MYLNYNIIIFINAYKYILQLYNPLPLTLTISVNVTDTLYVRTILLNCPETGKLWWLYLEKTCLPIYFEASVC